MVGLAATGGIGFTVSLLVAELSFPHGSAHTEDAKIAILVGSVLAAIVGAAILSRRNKHYRALAEKESVDADDNGIPDNDVSPHYLTSPYSTSRAGACTSFKVCRDISTRGDWGVFFCRATDHVRVDYFSSAARSQLHLVGSHR